MSPLQPRGRGLIFRLVDGLLPAFGGLGDKAVCHRWCPRRCCTVPVTRCAASKRITARRPAISRVCGPAVTIRPGSRRRGSRLARPAPIGRRAAVYESPSCRGPAWSKGAAEGDAVGGLAPCLVSHQILRPSIGSSAA